MAFALYFLLLKSTDSWSLLHSRHQDSTGPADFDVRGTTEEDFEEGAKSEVFDSNQQQAKTLELSLVSSKRWTAFATIYYFS